MYPISTSHVPHMYPTCTPYEPNMYPTLLHVQEPRYRLENWGKTLEKQNKSKDAIYDAQKPFAHSYTFTFLNQQQHFF